jgi:hypothetical protein
VPVQRPLPSKATAPDAARTKLRVRPQCLETQDPLGSSARRRLLVEAPPPCAFQRRSRRTPSRPRAQAKPPGPRPGTTFGPPAARSLAVGRTRGRQPLWEGSGLPRSCGCPPSCRSSKARRQARGYMDVRAPDPCGPSVEGRRGSQGAPDTTWDEESGPAARCRKLAMQGSSFMSHFSSRAFMPPSYTHLGFGVVVDRPIREPFSFLVLGGGRRGCSFRSLERFQGSQVTNRLRDQQHLRTEACFRPGGPQGAGWGSAAGTRTGRDENLAAARGKASRLCRDGSRRPSGTLVGWGDHPTRG